MFEQTANGCDRAVGDWGLAAKKLKAIGDALSADFADRHVDVDHLFKPNRVAVVALSVDARPANILPVDFTDHAEPEAP